MSKFLKFQLLFTLPFAATVVLSTETLRQVHVITRHGARMPLSKHPDSLLEASGAILTPLGQKQHYDLGIWLRNRYGGLIDNYDDSTVRLTSSQQERTIVSANSLALGLFPPNTRLSSADMNSLPVDPANIPIYTKESENDVTIRAYKNCPTFKHNLSQLYKSKEWEDLESAESDLLYTLGGLFPDEAHKNGKVPLKSIYNVYDAIHVAKTECEVNESSSACVGLPDPTIRNALSFEQFQELERLVSMTESLRYGPGTAQDLTGSNLLWMILDHMKNDDGKFFLHSGHYPTIYGFFAALGEVLPTDTMPEYASAILVELYHDDNDSPSVKVFFKDGGSDTAQQVQLRSCGMDKDTCSFDTLFDWAKKNTVRSQGQWCHVCNNKVSDVCLRELAAGKSYPAMSSSSDKKEVSTGTAVFTFFVGLLAGVAAMVISNRMGVHIGSSRSVESTDAGSTDMKDLQLDVEQTQPQTAVTTPAESTGAVIT